MFTLKHTKPTRSVISLEPQTDVAYSALNLFNLHSNLTQPCQA